MSSHSPDGKALAWDLRPMQRQDNQAMAAIVRRVLGEFGMAREGFAFADTELDRIYETFQPPEASYYVLACDGRIGGGGGYGPLAGGDPVTAELKKMYFIPELRGLGYGRALIDRLLRKAQEVGYQQIYLETTEEMTRAIALYEMSGFQRLNRPLGDTGHFGCKVWMLRHLR